MKKINMKKINMKKINMKKINMKKINMKIKKEKRVGTQNLVQKLPENPVLKGAVAAVVVKGVVRGAVAAGAPNPEKPDALKGGQM